MVCAAVLVALATITASPQVPDKVQAAAHPFPPDRVRLLESPFKTAQEADKKYLLSLEADRLLSWFRKNAGLEPKAPNYGGWENQMLAGHSLGHYLTACSYMYACTGDARLKEKVDTIVAELKECQDKRGDGYIAAMPNADTLWATIKSNGTLRGRGSYINGYWAPWYTLHKQYAGLLDAYMLCGNKTALEVAKKFGDWAIEETRNLSPENWQNMLDGEFGGMAESLANLYGLTGEKKYLDLAFKFHHKSVMDPLEKGEHKLAGLHGNTQIPKAIGAAREYELTGEDRFKKIAANFWDQVVSEHTYAIGGNTSGESFGPPNQLANRLTGNACETCNTYNMLKLTRHLFTWSPSAKLGDYYERALYNHILASQNPQTGMMCYYVSMQPGGRKAFSRPFDDFWCCVGTGMENHARYGDAIYFHSGNRLWVNLFVPSTLDWKEKGTKVRIEPAFPTSFGVYGGFYLWFDCDKPTELEVSIRVPSWQEGIPDIALGTKLFKPKKADNGFVNVRATFRRNQALVVRFDPKLHLEPVPGDPSRKAILFGPYVLAGWTGDSIGLSSSRPPALVTGGKDPAGWIASQPSGVWQTVGVGRPVDLPLTPFYGVIDDRYTVYWDFLTEAEWTKREEERKAEEAHAKELDARTVDQVRTGFQQSERAHNLQSDRSSTGDFNGRRYRHADGWFSYDLKVDPNGPNELLLTFWGSDGGRTFDLFLGETKVATIRLSNAHPNAFFDDAYKLDEALTKGKEKVTVKLVAHQGSIAGGLFGMRILKPKP